MGRNMSNDKMGIFYNVYVIANVVKQSVSLRAGDFKLFCIRPKYFTFFVFKVHCINLTDCFVPRNDKRTTIILSVS